MASLSTSMVSCIDRIRTILSHARGTALRTANAAMVAAYWHIGREIVEEEQRGTERAEYGARLIHRLSCQLSEEFGKGFTERNVRYIRQFYLAFADRTPIWNPVSSELRSSRAGRMMRRRRRGPPGLARDKTVLMRMLHSKGVARPADKIGRTQFLGEGVSYLTIVARCELPDEQRRLRGLLRRCAV